MPVFNCTVKGRLSGIYKDAIQNQLKTAQSRGILEDKQRIERMARERADYRFRLGRKLVHDAEQCSICGVEHGREVQSRGRHGHAHGRVVDGDAISCPSIFVLSLSVRLRSRAVLWQSQCHCILMHLSDRL
jgi:hypothetical protein